MKLLVILLIAIAGNSAMAESINLELWAREDILILPGTSETQITGNFEAAKCLLNHDNRGFQRTIKVGARFFIAGFSQEGVSRLELISSESGNNYSMDCVHINKKLSFDDIINLLLAEGNLVPETDL